MTLYENGVINIKKLLVILISLVFLLSTIQALSAADIWIHTQDRHHKAWTSPNGFKFDDKANTLGFWGSCTVRFYDKNSNLIESRSFSEWGMASRDMRCSVPANASKITIEICILMEGGYGARKVTIPERKITIPAGETAMVFSSIDTRKNFHLQTLDLDGRVVSTGYINLKKDLPKTLGL